MELAIIRLMEFGFIGVFLVVMILLFSIFLIEYWEDKAEKKRKSHTPTEQTDNLKNFFNK